MKYKKYYLYLFLVVFYICSSFFMSKSDELLFFSFLNIARTLAFCFLGFSFINGIIVNKEKNPLSVKEVLLIGSFAIYQPMHFWFLNLSEMTFFSGFLICFISYFVFYITYKLTNLFIKNPNKALLLGLLASIYLVNPINVFSILFILFILSEITISKIKKPLCVFSGMLLLMNLGLFLYNIAIISYKNLSFFYNNREINIDKYIDKKPLKNRDIYVILLDEYSGTDILKQKYNFDNAEFIKALKSRGFYIFDKMLSNYNYTYGSLPVFFNLDYLDCNRYKTTLQAVNNGLIFRIARKLNYEIYYENNTWFKLNSPYINHLYSEQQNNDINNILQTFYKNRIVKTLLFNIEKKQKGKNIFSPLDISSKKFVFIHKMMPHEPFKYDEYGKEIPIEEQDRPFLDKNYLPYLKYTNKKTIELVDEILKNSKTPPVIVISGDHGMRDEKIFDSMFSTFTAYYNPEHKYEHIKSSKTLINFFANFYNYEMNTKIIPPKDKIIYIRFIHGPNEQNICDWLQKESEDVTSKYLP